MATFDAVLDRFRSFVDADPTYRAQLAVHVGDQVVVDVAAGPAVGAD